MSWASSLLVVVVDGGWDRSGGVETVWNGGVPVRLRGRKSVAPHFHWVRDRLNATVFIVPVDGKGEVRQFKHFSCYSWSEMSVRMASMAHGWKLETLFESPVGLCKTYDEHVVFLLLGHYHSPTDDVPAFISIPSSFLPYYSSPMAQQVTDRSPLIPFAFTSMNKPSARRAPLAAVI